MFAAVAAARLGAKVAIVELNGFFGGVATASLVNIWHSLWDLRRENKIVGGLTEEVIDRLRRVDAVTEHFRSAPGMGSNHYELNSEVLKFELDHLVVEAGIRPFLHTMFVCPVVEDGRMTVAIIEDKSGRRAIRARQFIDATGDADVIARMGLPDNVPFYQIPFSSLVPRGSRNVLVAGRNIDADEGAFGAVRVMVNCNQMGQAAGVAAWLALDSDTSVDSLDTSRLRAALREQGAVII